MSRYNREGSPGPQGNTRPRARAAAGFNHDGHGRDRNDDRDYDRDYNRDRNRDRKYDRDYDREYDRRRDTQTFLPPRPQVSDTYRPHELPPRPPAGPSGGGDGYRPPQNDFNFRFNAPETVQREIDRFERDPPPPPAQSRPPRTRDARDSRNARRSQHPQPRFQPKGPWRKFVPAERELLSGAHAYAPTESLFNKENGVTYRDLDELSDSDEADMDISDDSDSRSEGKEPSQKRARVSGVESATAQNAPKWSNPDPYTAVPPGGASQTKKKDVVQLIRKARVQAKQIKSSTPTEAADFISCDFDDSDEEANEDHLQLPNPDRGHDRVPSDSTVQMPSGLPPMPAGLPPKPPMPQGQPGHVTKPEAFDLDKRQTVDLTMGDFNEPTRRSDVVAGAFPPPLLDDRNPYPYQDPTHSALGNRKRTHDDHIKTKFAPRRSGESARGLTEEWVPVSAATATPWFQQHNDLPAGSSQMLHQEIDDYYNFVRPRQFEKDIRAAVVKRLKTFCRDNFGDAEVYPFGSYPSDLYLPTSDMDLAFVSDQFYNGGKSKYGSKKHLFNVRSILMRNKIPLHFPEVVPKAKVPLVKFIDHATHLKIDISFETKNGMEAVKTFKAWKADYPAMPYLVTLIKQFLAMRGLNEPQFGGIGGFSVICLVVSLLQLQPEAQTRSRDSGNNLGKLLLTFLDFYGNHFRYDKVAISLNPPRYVPKDEVTEFPYRNIQRLSIIDPNNPANDIAGGSSQFRIIAQEFSTAHDQLCERMHNLSVSSRCKELSILDPLLAGNYTNYQKQRDRLERMAAGYQS